MKGYYIGILYLVAYVIAIAAGDVWVNIQLQGKNVFGLALPVFVIATFFFAFVSMLTKNSGRLFARNNILNLVKINVYSAGAWLISFICLKFLSPASFASILFMGMALIGNLYSNCKGRSVKIAIYLTVILLGSVFYKEYATYGVDTLYFCVLALFAALSSFFMMQTSRKLYSEGFSVYQTLSIRFYFTIIISFFIIGYNRLVLTFDDYDFLSIVSLSFVMLIIPVYLVSSALTKVNEITVSNMITIIPLMTFFIQVSVNENFGLNFIDFSISFLASLLLISLEVSKKIDENEEKQCMGS